MDSDRLNLLAQVATWYYEDGLSQEEVAIRANRSRSMVSRMLREARDLGIVEIRVRHPLVTNSVLEAQLCDLFGLQSAAVLAEPPADYQVMLERLGTLGAREVQLRLREGLRLGISWGMAVRQVVDSIASLRYRDVHIVQVIGSMGFGDPAVDGMELARSLAEKLGATYRSLSAPQIVESPDVARGLLQDRSVAEVLALAAKVDVALIGIGVFDPPELSALWRAGYLSQTALQKCIDSGAVAEILSRLLDIDGKRVVDCWLSDRAIGIDLDTLDSIPTVVAVAGGAVKTKAVLAALRSGTIDVIVTDAGTAHEVIAAQSRTGPDNI